MAKSVGKVSQIIGPVVDVEFSGENNSLPKIYDALEIKKEDGSKLVLEVQSHIGEETVRTISMDSTDGLSRGVEATSLESPIQMPIGEEINGRLFNVIGDAIDGMPNLPKDNEKGLPIHRAAPAFETTTPFALATVTLESTFFMRDCFSKSSCNGSCLE